MNESLVKPPLFHITTTSAWHAAAASGEYRPSAYAREGFIHCSHAHQLAGVANRLFKDVPGLVLLEIDQAVLTCRVVEENLEGGDQLFPHVYGALPVSAVIGVRSFFCDGTGTVTVR